MKWMLSAIPDFNRSGSKVEGALELSLDSLQISHNCASSNLSSKTLQGLDLKC